MPKAGRNRTAWRTVTVRLRMLGNIGQLIKRVQAGATDDGEVDF